ncbi:DUF4229 domain-containing protein [Nocardioides dongkuii]|uniref:DUF4229 domain-containing protein n=1 Tax=Nocardioides dongkuii TaxID=2760089 RepID=UPI0015FBFF16|nr:DUF4229 domain-containing protein [Nocardioides dongkuii]
MKEFWIYTLLRLALFAGAFAIVFSAWLLIAGEANILICVIVAFLVSGVGSYFLLERPRRAFAVRVEERAARASARFEEKRAREDVD